MDYTNEILVAFELHSVQGINEAFQHGVSPNDIVKGKPLLYNLVNMYTRGPLFKECIRAFVDHGLVFEDKLLLSVLLDDATALDKLLDDDISLLERRYSFDCAYTPLHVASLLHICAEYNHVHCARVLVNRGMDINVRAGIDENGFGGQTPIFHTVNQHANRCIDVLNYFLTRDPDTSITVKGLIWGKGYEWETFIPSVNPISYSMMGLLRQFQRTETQIYEIVSLLLKHEYGIEYSPTNVPNRYLNS